MKNKTAIIACNNVQNELYKYMVYKGIDCEIVDINKTSLENFDRVILPFPSRKEKISFLSDIFNVFTEGQTVIGGLFDEESKNAFSEAGIECVDYFSSEAYVLKNAYLTSQGTIRLLLENTEDFVAGKNALITGFGRIGKSLALMLKALGVKVSVAVRSDVQASDAISLGFDVFRLSQISSVLFYFDFIFNTVPFRIFDDKDISRIKNEGVYFEIASDPFGAEKNSFEKYEKKFVNASALPGKFYPKAVAENIYRQVFCYTENRKERNCERY